MIICFSAEDVEKIKGMSFSVTSLALAMLKNCDSNWFYLSNLTSVSAACS